MNKSSGLHVGLIFSRNGVRIFCRLYNFHGTPTNIVVYFTIFLRKSLVRMHDYNVFCRLDWNTNPPLFYIDRLGCCQYWTIKEPYLWPPYGIGQTIIFLPCGFFYLPSIFFSSPNLSHRRLDVCHTSTHGVRGLSANLRCRSETCCTPLAENTGRKNSRQKSPSGHHRTTLSAWAAPAGDN